MSVEIERKFLVRDQSWREHADDGVRYVQGYLATNERCSVRVRIGGAQAWLNLKSATKGTTRQEFEYEIGLSEAQDMLASLCTSALEKTRYRVRHSGHLWEVDVFEGDNEGLVVAEIELQNEAQTFAKPSWLGDEVTEDARYYNAYLAQKPFSRSSC